MTNPENTQAYEIRFFADAEVTRAEQNDDESKDNS